MRFAALPASIGLVLACLPTCFAADAPDSHAAEFFEKNVRPVLADHCLSCHGAEKPRGGLRLDSKAAFLKGADDGPDRRSRRPGQEQSDPRRPPGRRL